MEKPTKEELVAALTLADCGPMTWRCDQVKWRRVMTPMFKYCEGDENPTEAAVRILAKAYRAAIAEKKEETV